MSDNSSIQIGSMVVCIRDDFGPSPFPDRHPYKGQILTVRDIFDVPVPLDPQPLALRFDEIVNPVRAFPGGASGEEAFLSEHFRPVRKTDISVFSKHLMPMKDYALT